MINVALIGLGRIGIMHAENLNSHKNFNLKYIFDINKTLTSKLSKKLNSTPINNPQEAFIAYKINLKFTFCNSIAVTYTYNKFIVTI